jgi:hypothetical protein
MVTVNELIEEVRDVLDEPTAAQWTDAQLRRWLSEGNRDIARVTHHYKTTDEFPTIADVSEYTMAEDIITIEHAYYSDGSQDFPLQPKHFEQMDGIWGARMGWSGAWPAYFTTWGNQPTLIMKLFPVPTTNGDVIKLFVSVIPEPLSADGDEDVEVPPAWYDILADYCMYKAMLRDRDPTMDRMLAAYTQKRDALMHNNEYISTARELVPDPRSQMGYVPGWLADMSGII